MDLKFDCMIPYLANNPYIYGERPEPVMSQPMQMRVEETLLNSIKNPIPCYRDDFSSNQSYSETSAPAQTALYQHASVLEKSPQPKYSVQVSNLEHHSSSPMTRPLNFTENPNLAVQGYQTRQRIETPKSSCYSSYKPETHYLEVPQSMYPDRGSEVMRRDYSTPGNKNSSEARVGKDERVERYEKPERVEQGYVREQVCSYEAPSSSHKNFSGYSNQMTRPSDYSSNNYDIERSSTYSRSDYPSQELKSYTRESSSSRRQEPHNYNVDRYLKENTYTGENYPVRAKDPEYLNQVHRDTVLTENNMTTPTRSMPSTSNCSQPTRSGAFLDDIIEKYKDKIVEKAPKTNYQPISRDFVSRTSNYTYKEDAPIRPGLEFTPANTRPTREVWMEQTKNNEEKPMRAGFGYERLNKSSQNLLGKAKTRSKSNKKKNNVRSSSNNKEKWSCERKAFEDMVVKVLKLHAKHCPALRKEIDSMKFSRIFNI